MKNLRTRNELIKMLAGTLNKNSKRYREDYDNICKAVNRKTRKELIEALNRQNAVLHVSQSEIDRHCQV